MAFRQQSFFGASISSFSTTVGWNEQSSELGVLLVEDPASGDRFSPPIIGAPVYFTYDNFTFGGILQSYKENNSTDGKPTYTVSLVSPTEILAGAQLIINGFADAVNTIPNLINVYGYFENRQYGSSQVNDAGTPAAAIYSAIHDLTYQSPTPFFSAYGKPLNFRGYAYSVDLSRLPTLSPYYRIGGNNLSILDFINEIAADYGFDFFTELVQKTFPHPYEEAGTYNVIRVTPVYRSTQPTSSHLNQISEFIRRNRDNVSSNEIGRELRNEACSVFLVGGNKTDLLLTQDNGLKDYPILSTITPYWGLDADGNFIQSTGTGDQVTFDVDSRTVNILGVGSTYTMTVAELRFALTGQDEWESYITNAKPDLAVAVGIVGPFQPNMSGVAIAAQNNARLRPSDFQNTSEERMVSAGNKGNGETLENVTNLYQYVKSYAENYYGRKYLVDLPFNIGVKRIPETNEVVFDMEPTDGGYLPEGSNPLGLTDVNEDIFTLQDGRFEPFARFDNPSGLRFGNLDPNSYAVDSGGLFVKCTVEPGIVFGVWQSGLYPRAIISVPDVFSAEDYNDVGGKLVRGTISLIASDGRSVASSGEKQHLSQTFSGPGAVNSYVGYFPKAKMPDYVAVPMKSNRETYGPWFKVGAAGKTTFIQDESYVPWAFGGFAPMNLAANAKINDSITFMQEGEMGSITMVGSPLIPLGSGLIAGGPNVTSISTSTGPGGVETTYQMRTYTPRFGVLSKNSAERWRRLGMLDQQNRRQLRQALRSNVSAPAEFFEARANALVTERRDIRARSPHEVLFGEVIDDPEGSGLKRTIVTMTTINDAVSNLQPDQEAANSRAVAGLESLIRPVSFNRKSNSFANLSTYGPATGQNFYDTTYISYTWLPPMTDSGNHYYYVGNASGLHYRNANPFNTQHDVEYLSVSGLNDLSMRKVPSGIQPYGPDYQDNIKAFALKTPLVLTGWGYELNGRPVPRDSGDAVHFTENHAKKPHLWKTGPLDVRWNENNGTWMAISPSFPSIFAGTLLPTNPELYTLGNYNQGYKARLDDIIVAQTGDASTAVHAEVAIWNPCDWPLNSGARCLLGYSGSNGNIESGRYYVMSTQTSRVSVPCDVGCYNGVLGVSYRIVYAHVDNNNQVGICPDPLSGVKNNTTYTYA